MPEFVVIVVVVILAVLAAVVVARLQKRGRRKQLRLEVVNLGNAWSRYGLYAAEPTGSLVFEFTLDGDPLLEDGLEAHGQGGGGATVPHHTTTPAPASSGQPEKEKAQAPGEAKEKAGQAAAQAQEKAKLALTLGGAIADILGTVGMILPRSVGSPMLQAASRMRRGQSTATRVQQAPRQIGGQVEKVKSASSAAQQVPATPPVQPQAVPLPQEMPAAPAFQPGTMPSPEQMPAASAARPGVTPTAQPIEPGWVLTPSVQPGGTLAIGLLVTGPRSNQTQHFEFDIFSRSVEQVDSPVVSETDSFQIRGVSWFFRVLPYLAIVAVAAAAIVYALWLLNPGVLS